MGVSLAWGQVNSLVKRFALNTMLGVRGQCVWYLVLVVIFMGLRGAKRWGDRKGWGGGGGGNFMGAGVDSSRHHI